MENHQELARRFRSMHDESSLFVMPCAWDSFSALLFEKTGFSCIGTTSGGVNWVRGRKDYIYNRTSKRRHRDWDIAPEDHAGLSAHQQFFLRLREVIG